MGKLLLTLALVAFSSGVLCINTESQYASIGQTFIRKNMCESCSEVEPGNGFTVVKGFGAYKLHKCLKAWNDARRSCLENNAQLAIINSVEEASMLIDWMNREKVGKVWIGTHGYFKDNDWVTLTGDSLEAAGYDNWLTDEPNNAGNNEYCGTLVNSYGMNDLTCSSELPYFCKIYMCADLL